MRRTFLSATTVRSRSGGRYIGHSRNERAIFRKGDSNGVCAENGGESTEIYKAQKYIKPRWSRGLTLEGWREECRLVGSGFSLSVFCGTSLFGISGCGGA